MIQLVLLSMFLLLIDVDDLKEIDLKWQMAMLTMRARRFLQKTGRNLGANGPTSMGFDMAKVECYNCHRKGYFARECRSSKDSRRIAVAEPQRRNVLTAHTAFNVELSPTKPDKDLSHTHRPSAPIIEDWVSESEDDFEAEILQNALSFVQPTEQVKTHRPSVKPTETSIPAANHKTVIPTPKTHGNNRNRKACFVCKSLTNLIKDCDYYEKKIAQTSARNHAKRGNHQQYARMTLLNPQRHVVPTAVLTKSKLVPLTATRPVTTAVSQTHDKGVIDNGCSRHMTGNMSYLSDLEEINGGYVAFGGNPKGDSFGKFDEKVDEGFLVGYSVSSKAFRVFNSRTCIVQETLHVNFLENKPNVAGSGPTWLFDIDTLTKTMNYQPVTTGNQTNHSADATFDEKEPEFQVKKPESEVNVSPSSKFEDFSDNNINKVNAASTLVPTVGQFSPDSTNTFSAAGPSNAAASLTHGKSSWIDASQCPDDPNMPELVDITYFDNLETSITVSPIPTTRVHKDHLVTQIIGDLSSATQTRSMTRVAKDQGGLSQINSEDFHTYVKSAFLYGTIEEQVYVYQPPGFEDPDHPDKFYKVVKALYRLHQALRAWLKKLELELVLLTYKFLMSGLMNWCCSLSAVRFQALFDKKKVVVTEALIRDVLCLDDAEGVECLPKEEIFAELAIMGYEKPSTKLMFYKAFFSSHLVRNVDSPSKFYMYPRFLQLIIQKQVGDLSTHTTKYTSPALTQKVDEEVDKGADEVPVGDVNTAKGAHKGDVSGAHAEVPTVDEEPSIPSPAPPTPPPQPSQDVPSTSQEQPTPPQSPQKVGTTQRVETSDETMIDDVSNQGRMIAEMDQDSNVVLEETKEVADDAKADQDAKEDESEPTEVQEVVEVVTTVKVITEVVNVSSETITAASTTITAAEAQVPAATLTAAPSRVTAAPSRKR
nr:hypothetical protein [Tanacetum cinerariifolium]